MGKGSFTDQHAPELPLHGLCKLLSWWCSDTQGKACFGSTMLQSVDPATKRVMLLAKQVLKAIGKCEQQKSRQRPRRQHVIA